MKIYMVGSIGNIVGERKRLFKRVSKKLLEISSYNNNNQLLEFYMPDYYFNVDLIDDLYKINNKHLIESDILLAYVGESSLDIGFDIARAFQLGKKIIMYTFDGEDISDQLYGFIKDNNIPYLSSNYLFEPDYGRIYNAIVDREVY